ncbi:MAG: hypothetical protein CM15mP12_6840 [Gammaproteobacteria bacterium]|nr:MAG: hypothetical protein CM15mP12_6840 [Gammaproteobacteria bacterium]
MWVNQKALQKISKKKIVCKLIKTEFNLPIEYADETLSSQTVPKETRNTFDSYSAKIIFEGGLIKMSNSFPKEILLIGL